MATAASIAWRVQRVRADNEELRRIATAHAGTERGIMEAQEKITAAGRDEAALASALAEARRVPTTPDSSASAKPAAITGPDISLLMERDPQLRALFIRTFRANLALRYQVFYEAAGLSAEQIEKLETLLTEGEQDRIDLDFTARAGGMDKSSPEYLKLRKELRDRYTQEQLKILGEQGTRRLQQYSRIEPLIGFMNSVGTAVAQTSEPLTMQQMKPILEILAKADKAFRDGGKADPTTIKWEKALPEAKKILSPAQFESLKVHSNLSEISHLLKTYHQKQNRE